MKGFLHELRNLGLVLLIPLTAITQSPTLPTAITAVHGDYSSHIETSGGRRYLHCGGEGSPTVLLESDTFLMTTEAWRDIQQQVARFPRVCGYDRANVGQSGAASGPRTVQQMADDLAVLLHDARVPGPYVLASFGFGSLVDRLYASQHPDDVAGVVLIDPLSEELEARWQALVPAELWSQRINTLWQGNPEQIAFAESFAQMRSAAPLPDVPTVVLVHDPASLGAGLIPDRWPAVALEAVWQELVAAQASRNAGGVLIVAPASGHDIVADSPDKIVWAIRSVVWPPLTPAIGNSMG